MNKSRRDFLKKLPLAMSIPFTLGGIPMRAMADNALTRLARASADNDRVLVILQMHGGNDGLNSLIPVLKYDEYYSKRANIAIPAKNSLRKYIELDRTLPSEMQAGLHPDMQAMKSMYDTGRVAIVQGVSYKNNNGSHFRGRDIWFMGGSADDYYQSGWVGRYLQGEFAPQKYPDDFPNAEMPDPLAIELGSDVSLLFHQEGSIPTSISLSSVPEFADLVENLDGFKDELVDPRGLPPDVLKGSPYHTELEWILSLEDKSKDYAAKLLERYIAGGNPTVNYPTAYPFNAPKGSLNNPLNHQLSMVARLLAGGCKTKVFLVKIGGFDTHADQVEKYDPTMGSHAALMYHISSGMKAFQEDLRARGIEDKVLSLTTSEFGRRVQSNGSYGTDHGTAGPMFIFGKGVQPGVHGEAFKITQGNNLEMQYDYRTVYASLMLQWMKVSETQLDTIFPGIIAGVDDEGPFEPLLLAQDVITGNEGFIGDRFALEDCFPNPAKGKTTVHFRINTANQVVVNLLDNQGRQQKVLINNNYAPGEYKIEVELTDLPPGNYICQLKSGFYQESKKLVIIK